MWEALVLVAILALGLGVPAIVAIACGRCRRQQTAPVAVPFVGDSAYVLALLHQHVSTINAEVLEGLETRLRVDLTAQCAAAADAVRHDMAERHERDMAELARQREADVTALRSQHNRDMAELRTYVETEVARRVTDAIAEHNRDQNAHPLVRIGRHVHGYLRRYFHPYWALIGAVVGGVLGYFAAWYWLPQGWFVHPIGKLLVSISPLRVEDVTLPWTWARFGLLVLGVLVGAVIAGHLASRWHRHLTDVDQPATP